MPTDYPEPPQVPTHDNQCIMQTTVRPGIVLK
jgi:hypothetical protein